MSKNPSEEDIAEWFGLIISYLSENYFTEVPTGSKNRNYAFITAPEHVCNELIKLNSVTFQDMYLKVQEVRQSYTRFNEKRNITSPLLKEIWKVQQMVCTLETVLNY